MVQYYLPESVVTITGSVDLVVDNRLAGDVRRYLGAPTAVVTQSVRGDRSHGSRDLVPPTRGDNTWTVELSVDERLTSVGYNSIGVGSKVVGAGVKVVAVIAGAAVRIAGALAGLAASLEAPDGTEPRTDPPTAEEARNAWTATHGDEVGHAAQYSALARSATSEILAVRQALLTSEDSLASARYVRRLQQLGDLVADALAEQAKVDGLYRAWSESRIERHPQRFSFTFSIDELPVHDDPSAYALQLEQAEQDRLGEVWEKMWELLGIRVEIGPVPPDKAWRPNPTGVVVGDPSDKAIHWRTARPARLWVWRRTEGEPGAVLESAIDTLVTDRYSASASLNLEGRWFGEASVQLTMSDLGAPSKLAAGDKSAVGAIADAIAAAPEQFTAGLDAVSKASTTLGDLSSAGAEQRLKAIKRQLDQRTQELELQGLNATAESFAELKRLKQQVEIAEAQGSLAPPTELAKLEGELAKETAQRDLEAVARDRAQSAELAALNSEIARLTAEVERMKLQEQADAAPR